MGLLEERHEFVHALTDSLLLVLVVGLKHSGDSLFDGYQVLVVLDERGEDSQEDNICDTLVVFQVGLQYLQQEIPIGGTVLLDDVDTCFEGQFHQSYELFVDGVPRYQKLEDRFEEVSRNGVEVDSEEVGEELQPLLVELFIEQLAGGVDDSLEHGLDSLSILGLGEGLFCEVAEPFGGFVAVPLDESLQVETLDLLTVHLERVYLQKSLGTCSQFSIDIIFEYSEFDVVLEAEGVVGVVGGYQRFQHDTFAVRQVVQQVIENLAVAGVLNNSHEPNEQLPGFGESRQQVDIADHVGVDFLQGR